MSHLIRALLLSLGLLTLVGCTSKPLLTPKENFPAAMQISQAQMQHAILTALSKRQWMVQEVTPTLIRASILVKGQYLVEVDIPYSTVDYQINYRNSRNLNYKNGKIHRSYNNWVHKLSGNILRELHVDPILEAVDYLPAISQTGDTARQHLDFDSVVQEATRAGFLDGSVRFYLAGEQAPGMVNPLREVVTNKKTNAANKSEEQACRWALQAALISLQNAAKQADANAVVDIVSFYKRGVFSDSQKYECHTGALMAGVALKGQLAEIQ